MDATPNLLLVTVALLLCAGGAISTKPCPNCGTTQIPFPLSTGPDCGDQSYKIRCDAGRLKFDTLNNTYSITSISAQNQRLEIQPASISAGACVTDDFVHHGIQLNNTLPFNITSSNTVMFLNCTDAILQSPLNCSSNSLCHAYVNGSNVAGSCVDSPICCTFKTGGSTTAYMISVRESGCSAYASFVNLDPTVPVDRWPSPGVELQWASPKEPVSN